MILELENPSDPITFVGDDLKVAGIACLLLGHGWYGMSDEKGDTVIPLMMFGAHEKWLKENGIDDLSGWIRENALKVAEFLETVAYGKINDRLAFDEAIKRMTPEKAAEHREWWNDRNRSSMNDIGAGALRLAKQFRKLAAGGKADNLHGSPPIIMAGSS